VTSAVTAISDNFALTLVIRFVAGVFAGVLWGMLATYARRMVTPEHRGRAITIALASTPVALAIGTPAGTLLAGLIGWRFTFGVMALAAVLLILWVLTCRISPDSPKVNGLPLAGCSQYPVSFPS
jgi:predicted MFS family arabinose efflux permease